MSSNMSDRNTKPAATVAVIIVMSLAASIIISTQLAFAAKAQNVQCNIGRQEAPIAVSGDNNVYTTW
jgi:Na+-transporting NADH:ubiquinone oxidoreductase subunit NqrC